MKSSKHVIFEVFRRNGMHHWIQCIYLHSLAPAKKNFRHLFENYILLHYNHNLDILKAWDYAQTIFYSEKLQNQSRTSYQKISFMTFRKSESRPAGAFWADKIVFWARKASHRGLFGGWNEPESRPAGAFWAKYVISCEAKVACTLLEKGPRRL